MLSFSQYLTESLTSPLPWKWLPGLNSRGTIVAEFETPLPADPSISVVYQVGFKDYDSKRGMMYGPTPENRKRYFILQFIAKGDAFKAWYRAHGRQRNSIASVAFSVLSLGPELSRRVFSTLLDILRAFALKYDPDRIAFTADTDEPSRVRLYHRLMLQIPRLSPNYRGTEANKLNRVEYHIDKKIRRRSPQEKNADGVL